MPSLVKPTLAKPSVDRKVGLATTRPVHPPDQVARAVAVAGRGPLTENMHAKAVPLGRAEKAPPVVVSEAVQRVLRTEEPVRAGISPKLNPVTRAMVAPPSVKDKATTLLESVRRDKPEAPNHAHLGARPATTPRQAAENRTLRKRVAIARGAPRRPAHLGTGVSPTDLANGVTTPRRGFWTVNRKPARTGTPQAVLEAPQSELPVLETIASAGVTRAPVPAVLSPVLPEETSTAGQDTPAAEAAAPGEGAGRLLFLAGAVFVAWLVLRNGGA